MGRLKSLLRQDFSINTKALLATSGIRAFLIWTLLFFSAVSYGWKNFYRDPGSVFFDPSRAHERWYSQWREFQAESFIVKARSDVAKSVGKAGFQFDKAGTTPSICAAVQTLRRDIAKPYIEAAIGSLFQGLEPAERVELSLNIFFATAEPERHATWNQTWLRPLADKVYTYKDVVEAEQLEKLRGLESSGVEGWMEKEVRDYAIALRHCYETTSSPYIIIFEDDIIVAEGWLARTLLGLKDVERNMATRGSPGNWLYMRLFNEERAIGWASKTIGGNQEHLISLAVNLVICTVLVGWRRRSRVVRAHVDNWVLAVVCLLAVPSFVVLFYQSGKASILPPLPGVREERFGCCSQGMVFAREHVPGLIEYMTASVADHTQQPIVSSQTQVGSSEAMMRSYSRQTGLSTWALYPVQIQHIGIQAITGERGQETRAVWSTAFETLNPKSLDRTHARMVKQLYESPPNRDG